MCLKSEQEVYPGLHVPVVGKVPLNYGCRVSRQVPLKTIQGPQRQRSQFSVNERERPGHKNTPFSSPTLTFCGLFQHYIGSIAGL